jgi:hypothetical protein
MKDFNLIQFHFFFIPFALLVFLSPRVLSQPFNPDDGEVYREDVVPRVDIFIHPDTLAWIYNNPDSYIEWRATFVFDNGFVNDTIEEIGFRLRGNTSRYRAKKSFKISFNTYHTGRRYHGVKKLNLNGEHNDPSIARAKLCWDLAGDFGIAAARTNHVRLYINDNYHGLYVNVEHINDDFVESRFGNQYGNLYKCLWPADLDYISQNPDSYKFEHSGRRTYALKTHEAYDDYSDLAHFIDVLNNTPIDDLPCELEKIFNVQEYLKIMAFDILTGNWDGYIFNKNNFYLYHNPVTGKFEYVLYDLDNTFGIDWFGVDWGERNIYQWSPSNHQNEPRPLYNRLMQVQKYRDWFSVYMNRLINDFVVMPDYFDAMDEIRDRIYPYVQIDNYYTMDYGFTPADFLQAYETGWGAHVPYGLKDYISARKSSIQSQLQLNPIHPVVNYLSHDYKGIGQPVEVRVYAWHDQPGMAVWLYYNVDQAGYESLPMVLGDDGFYHATVPAVNQESVIAYFVEAQDASGNSTVYPCEPKEFFIAPAYSSGLYINEFMASNQTTIYDSEGDFEDWIELYNGSGNPVWLGDKFLTDKLNNPTKWPMPDYTMMPGEYLIIWADSDPEQGFFHANFSLSKDGEAIGIFNNEASGYAPIDTYVFGPQQTDISLGRSPDGSDNWVYFDDPTPGSANHTSVVVDSQDDRSRLLLFPNPVTGGLLNFSQTTSFSIFNLSGVKMMDHRQVDQIEVTSLPKGVYILKTTENESIKFIVY